MTFPALPAALPFTGNGLESGAPPSTIAFFAFSIHFAHSSKPAFIWSGGAFICSVAGTDDSYSTRNRFIGASWGARRLHPRPRSSERSPAERSTAADRWRPQRSCAAVSHGKSRGLVPRRTREAGT